MTESLTYPEAKVSETAPRIDWKFPVFLVVLNLIAVAVQWGAISTKLEELSRRQEQQDRHMEFIDNELRVSGGEEGEVKEFRRDVDRRLKDLDDKLNEMRKR